MQVHIQKKKGFGERFFGEVLLEWEKNQLLSHNIWVMSDAGEYKKLRWQQQQQQEINNS